MGKDKRELEDKKDKRPSKRRRTTEQNGGDADSQSASEAEGLPHAAAPAAHMQPEAPAGAGAACAAAQPQEPAYQAALAGSRVEAAQARRGYFLRTAESPDVSAEVAEQLRSRASAAAATAARETRRAERIARTSGSVEATHIAQEVRASLIRPSSVAASSPCGAEVAAGAGPLAHTPPHLDASFIAPPATLQDASPSPLDMGDSGAAAYPPDEYQPAELGGGAEPVPQAEPQPEPQAQPQQPQPVQPADPAPEILAVAPVQTPGHSQLGNLITAGTILAASGAIIAGLPVAPVALIAGGITAAAATFFGGAANEPAPAVAPVQQPHEAAVPQAAAALIMLDQVPAPDVAGALPHCGGGNNVG